MSYRPTSISFEVAPPTFTSPPSIAFEISPFAFTSPASIPFEIAPPEIAPVVPKKDESYRR